MLRDLADMLSIFDVVIFRTGKTSVTVGSVIEIIAFVVAIWWLAAILERIALRISHRYVDEPWKTHASPLVHAHTVSSQAPPVMTDRCRW